MKVFHMRKNYSPFLSEETKELILNRKFLQEEAAKTKCKILIKEFNSHCKEVKKAVAKDEEEFLRKGLMVAWTQQKHGEQLMNYWEQ